MVAMRSWGRKLVVGALERAIAAGGFEGSEARAARADAVDWARQRMRAARNRSGVVGGLGVVVTQPGRAELRPVDVALPGPGEVTVELLASAVSAGTERAQWLRLPNARPELPFAPGYSGAGPVIAVGSGVEGPAKGTLVAVPRARHASVVTVPAEWVTPVPEGVRAEEAALVYLAIISGYGVRRAGDVTGSSACVLGAGPIGALALRLLLLRNPGPVTVVASTERRKEAALRAGAAEFRTAVADPAEIGAGVVIEATGDPAAFRSAVQAADEGGTVVLLGSPRGVTTDTGLAEVRRKGLTLVGAHVSALATEAKRTGGDPFAELSREFLNALADGTLEAGDLVGEPIDPREAGLFYRGLGRGEVGAAHFDWRRVPRAERVRHGRLASPPRLRAQTPRALSASPAPGAASGPLRFAVVGCGDIGLPNARAVAGARNASVVLCHDPVVPLAEAAAQECGGEVAADLAGALDRERVDAVFLSVPHHLHTPLVREAAEAGLHVVVEKPLANDLPAADEAVEAAAKAGVALSVCFSFRYEPPVLAARAAVRAGALGKLKGAALVFHADKPPSYWTSGFSGRATSDWRVSRERAGGGVLIMNLTHYVDLIRDLSGCEPEWVAGTSRTEPGSEVEDAVALAIGFGGGALGTFSGSASSRGTPGTLFELWGEMGSLRLEPSAAIYTERAVEGVEPARWTPLSEEGADARTLFVEAFCDAVLAGRPPEVTGGDGLAVQQFVEAAYRSIEEDRPVSLLEEGTPA